VSQIVTEKLKRNKSPGTDQTPAEFIKTRGLKIRSENHNIINFVWNKKDLPGEWKIAPT
jgi:hypothetical protein